jgi:hypothetical protein
MTKTKVCIAVAVCVLGFFLAVSCSKSKHPLKIECDESGAYLVDVAKWQYYQGVEETLWLYTVTDAMGKAWGFYAEPGTGMPHYYGNYEVHLESFTVTWPSDAKIPNTQGALDVVVPSNLDKDEKVEFTFLLMPAINKDTVGVLSALRADPESNEFSNGELVVKGRVTIEGKDVLTDERVEAQSEVTACFADYMDPNNAH